MLDREFGTRGEDRVHLLLVYVWPVLPLCSFQTNFCILMFRMLDCMDSRMMQ